MQENDFFTWRRSMLVRFQEMATAEDVYTELQHQTQQLEYDYYALCVRHPVPFTRPKISVHTTYPQAWVAHYQSENYFSIDPVLKPENFRQGIWHGMMPYLAKRSRYGTRRARTVYAGGRRNA
ncbi:DNA-binding transcriptional activator SdiA [Citrobacter koseri]|nr:DNA-binding transcriptional activator SdiA [Citrobacter koseri]